MLRFYNIIWETDNEDASLPGEVITEEDIEEDLQADYLSDNFGFLVKNFEVMPLTEKRRRCLHCIYLVAGDHGKWICDDCGKDIEDIPDEDCSANQKW